MADNHDLYRYALRMGDSTLILSQRFCEQVGTAPMLEEEIALANIGLDLLGQGTVWLNHAGQYQGEGKTADDLAYKRTERDYTNYLICELENGDFGRIVLRAYLFTTFLHVFYSSLKDSTNPEFAAIATKSLKEVAYHVEHLSDWVERLGLGTEESHSRMTTSINFLWPYTQEMFDQDELENTLTAAGVLPSRAELYKQWKNNVIPFLTACDLTPPECEYFYDGGTKGVHTESMGYLLSEMQTVTREHPEGVW